MAYPYIPKPTEDEIIYTKSWELVEYFAKMFPKASIKIDVEYHSSKKFTIQHHTNQ